MYNLWNVIPWSGSWWGFLTPSKKHFSHSNIFYCLGTHIIRKKFKKILSKKIKNSIQKKSRRTKVLFDLRHLVLLFYYCLQSFFLCHRLSFDYLSCFIITLFRRVLLYLFTIIIFFFLPERTFSFFFFLCVQWCTCCLFVFPFLLIIIIIVYETFFYNSLQRIVYIMRSPILISLKLSLK